MTPSSTFNNTKLVTPNDSAAFFADLFDLGLANTNGRFNTYEIDFLLSNFAGCDACFEDVYAADKWYAGMADEALKRNITIQYCLASATDMLVSLKHPAVIQARASGDYALPPNLNSTVPGKNTQAIAGSSLLLGALGVAPSKDTLWTNGTQPLTASDMNRYSYTTQPHVQLDAVLAVLSLGPVGISDALGLTDPGLIAQTFRSKDDGTLLRPSRPLSVVDSALINASKGLSSQDVRSTHASIPGSDDEDTHNSHYLVSWMAVSDASLQPTDLYPVPASNISLAVRPHIFAPYGDAQLGGCVDGQQAQPTCMEILAPGVLPIVPAVGGTFYNYSLITVYEPYSNGAYFLGELNKFVHVSPQRFAKVLVGGQEACGLTVTVLGSAGEQIKLVGVDSQGITHIKLVTIPAGGLLDFAI